MIIDQVFDIHVPIWMSLGFIVLAVGAAIVTSLYGAPEELEEEVSHPPFAGGLAGIGARPKEPERPESHEE